MRCSLPLQWYASVPTDIASHMHSSNLLQQDKAAGGLLRVNLSPQLHSVLEEAFLFERQRMGVPPAAGALMQERQRLRALWVGAVQVSQGWGKLDGFTRAALAGCALTPDCLNACL